MNNICDKYSSMLTEDEKKALNYYATYSYKMINETLRRDNTDTYKKLIRDIDSALAKYPNKKGLKVYRGMFLAGYKLYDFLDSLENGKYLEKGYLSTSTVKRNSFVKLNSCNIRMEILVPIDMIGADISSFSTYSKEFEYLIGRDTLLAIDDINEIDLKQSEKILIKARAIDNLHL